MKTFAAVVVTGLLLSAAAPLTFGAERRTAQASAGADREASRQWPWGVAGDPSTVSRTIEVEMLDAMRFRPDAIDVRRGETVRFIVRNGGKLPHELVIGTKKALDRHAAQMAKTPHTGKDVAHDAHDHDVPYMIRVAPGETGEIVWKFNRRGRFEFACLTPGHYEAGMVGSIKVAAH